MLLFLLYFLLNINAALVHLKYIFKNLTDQTFGL